MPQMIWRAIDAGSWTWASPQWQRYTGQTCQDSEDWGWLDVVHPEDRGVARCSWQQAHAQGEFHADLRLRSGSGDYKWFQTRGKPVFDPNGQVIEWIGTSTDVDDLRRLQAEQKVLVAELQHRTRNLIAVVHSICAQTLQRASSLDDFRDRFEDRLSALSRVQGLLSTSEHDPITIRRLLEIELSALGDGEIGSKIVLDGPDTIIRNSTAQTLALAVHELSTNALKYGALSSSAGRLDVTWHEEERDGAPWLSLLWRETAPSRPPAAPQQKRGYGRILIEQALPLQLGARTDLSFKEGGLSCLIDLPLKLAHESDLS
ncbi:hypothetical protein ASE95_06010 [Sphingomonas sp. Leaf231]|nr:hypothetical protein ASE95_06010 [Sphingomonas sp. Leaf231]